MSEDRKERCATCRYWLAFAKTEDGELGDCHRFPPASNLNFGLVQAIELIRGGVGRPEVMTSNVGDSVWPMTSHDEWCGEWQDEPPPRPPVVGISPSPPPA